MTTGLLAGLVALLSAAQAPDAPAYAVEVRVVQVRGAMSDEFASSLESFQGIDATKPGVPFLKADGRIGAVPVRMEGDRLEINEGKDSPEVTTVYAAAIALLPRTDTPGPLQAGDVTSWLRSIEPWGAEKKTPKEALEFLGLKPELAQQFGDFLSKHWPTADAPAGQVWYPPYLVQDGNTEALSYFEHERGDYYRLRQTPRNLIGLLACVAARPGPDGQVDVDFLYHKQAVKERAVVKGTRLQAGVPVTDAIQAEQALRLTPGRWVGLRWAMAQKPDGQEFVFLRVTPQPMPELPRMHAADVRVFRMSKEEGDQIVDKLVPWDGAEHIGGDAVVFRQMKSKGAATGDLGGVFDEWRAESRRERAMGHLVHFKMGEGSVGAAAMMDLFSTWMGCCSCGKAAEEGGSDSREFSAAADEAMKEFKDQTAAMGEYEYTDGHEEERSGYFAVLGVKPGEGAGEYRAELAAFVQRPWPKPTGLRRLWQAKPDPPVEEQAFRYRFGTAEGEWTGFLQPVADGYAVLLIRFSDARSEIRALYQDLNPPKGEPIAEAK